MPGVPAAAVPLLRQECDQMGEHVWWQERGGDPATRRHAQGQRIHSVIEPRAATKKRHEIAHQMSRSLNTSLPGNTANMLAGNLNLTLSSGNQAKTWWKKRAVVCVEN
jgi:hypothetical protein